MSRTKTQRAFGIISALLVLFSGITGCKKPQAAPAIVRIDPNTVTINAGQPVEVLVKVENVEGLFGAELRIEFASQLLEVQDADLNKPEAQITPGDLLSPDMVEINRAGDGFIEYKVVQLPSKAPVGGNGTLARILFKSKAAGTTAITLAKVVLYNQDDMPIPATTQNGTIAVESSSAPAAISPPATAVPPTPTPIPPAPTPLPLPTPASGESPNCGRILGYHTVRRGETLYAIGRVYATRPDAIAACNNLSHPAIIHAGNRLAIPYAPWSPIPPGPIAERQFTPALNP